MADAKLRLVYGDPDIIPFPKPEHATGEGIVPPPQGTPRTPGQHMAEEALERVQERLHELSKLMFGPKRDGGPGRAA